MPHQGDDLLERPLGELGHIGLNRSLAEVRAELLIRQVVEATQDPGAVVPDLPQVACHLIAEAPPEAGPPRRKEVRKGCHGGVAACHYTARGGHGGKQEG